MEVDAEALLMVKDTARTAPGQMKTFFERRVRRTRDLFRKEIRAPMPLPPLPFVWSLDPAANARARAYYFAVIVPKNSHRGGGGRYPRTGELVKSVDIKAEFLAAYAAAQVAIYTRNPKIEFVFGNRQVPGHKAGGKPNLDEMAERYGKLLFTGVREDWLTVTDPFAGVR
jgi:hypothetical protein